MRRMVPIDWKCADCGGDSKPHYALGFCYNCYMRPYLRKRYRDRKAKAASETR